MDLFLMLNYEKQSVESDFPFIFNRQKKLTKLWQWCNFHFLAIFWNEITTILTPSTSEGGEWGRWGWSRFSFWRSLNYESAMLIYIHTYIYIPPFPQKWWRPPKNNFSLIYWKILFFLKKMLDKKYSKRRYLQKRLYWFLSPGASPSKEPCPPTNGFFAVFSKNTAFFEKLVL